MAEQKDRAWKIAQLAASLVSTTQSTTLLSRDGHIASTARDPYYAAALQRAETMLNWAEGKWGNLHAYRLFNEGETLTEEEILGVFSQANWSGLRSKQPVIDLMVKIRAEFKKELQRHDQFDELGSSTIVLSLIEDLQSVIDATFEHWLHTCNQDDAYSKTIRKEVLGLFKNRMNSLIIRQPELMATKFLDSIDTIVPTLEEQGEADIESLRHFAAKLKSDFAEQTRSLFPSGGSGERLHAQWERSEFYHWCFPAPNDDRRADRIYRPYEIFLHCAKNDWYPDKLVADSTSLKLDRFPGPMVDL